MKIMWNFDLKKTLPKLTTRNNYKLLSILQFLSAFFRFEKDLSSLQRKDSRVDVSFHLTENVWEKNSHLNQIFANNVNNSNDLIKPAPRRGKNIYNFTKEKEREIIPTN